MTSLLTRFDRRWVFLLMLIAMSVPILLGLRFPEKPSEKALTVFRTIEGLEDGSLVLMAFDFDPPSKGELQPMAAAFTRHCAFKKHKMIFTSLWPQGPPMIEESVAILKNEFPDYQYGRDYVVLGFQSGDEGVVRNVMSDVRSSYSRDRFGADLDDIELTRNLKNFQSVQLIVNVSAGKPGSKEWVQFAATPFERKMVVGTTGVQAVQLYPYLPRQLTGLLGAIKAAAEYEQTLRDAYPQLKDNPNAAEALRRMSPQLVGHLLIIFLIVAGNVLYFAGRRANPPTATPPAAENAPAPRTRSARVWAVVMLVAGCWLLYRATTMPIGTVWVHDEKPKNPEAHWTRVVQVDPKARLAASDEGKPAVYCSIPRTVGLWVAALVTLSVLSFLWGDNPAYRMVEAVVVGASAGYSILVGFWETLVPNLFTKLFPQLVRASINPEISPQESTDLMMVIPLILGIMMLCRLVPKAAWISRWPMAFFIGATAGLRLVANLEADFVRQIQSTIIPLLVLKDGQLSPTASLKNLTIFIGVLSSLTYFFFSLEHKGVAGKVSRLGIFFLMITFGAGFANTVMSRISLMAARLEFLFVDWLWLIDPTNKLGR